MYVRSRPLDMRSCRLDTTWWARDESMVPSISCETDGTLPASGNRSKQDNFSTYPTLLQAAKPPDTALNLLAAKTYRLGPIF